MQFADYAAPEVCATPPFRLNRRARRSGTCPQATQPHASMRPQPKQPSKTMRTLITAAHSRPVQYSQNHAYRQEAPTRLPHSFLVEGPRASRALSASRASSSPNSTGSSPAWPSPCRGRPSGRRGRTRRATMRACGLWPARQRASSACPCAGADQHRPNRNTRQDAPPSPQASSACNFWAVSQAESARNAARRRRFPRSAKPTANNCRRKPHRSPGPMAKSAPVSCETVQKSRGYARGRNRGNRQRQRGRSLHHRSEHTFGDVKRLAHFES